MHARVPLLPALRHAACRASRRCRGQRRVERLRCPACDFTHWNNPTPVLAAVIEVNGQMLLARNAAWPSTHVCADHGLHGSGRDATSRAFTREIQGGNPSLDERACNLIGVYDFQRMNQVIIAYHAVADR
jgi:NAD+ diphosphatase